MAEILSGLAVEILKKLGSQALQEVGSLVGLNDELSRLSDTVSLIQAVLEDAEEQQRRSHEVKEWIRRLKKVFFEADDLLDDFAAEVTHRKLVKNKVSLFFSQSNPLLYNCKMSKRLKAIRENLDAIATDKAISNLVPRPQQPLTNPVQVVDLDRQTYSFVPDEEVVGRKDDKETVVDFLLNREVEENVAVISIVGLGGLGKTTLAQWVYNDETVRRNFDKRLWVCVSDVFEVKTIAEKIIESATGEKVNDLQLDAVQNKLQQTLDGKKYLLVLDDVWNEDASKWSRLKNMLIGGAKGSKVLVTTRSDVVAEVSGSVCQHKLGDLSEEEAWTLFEKVAFECNKESENSNLVEIGKEIVKKCSGVPLAIRSVGSLLRLKRTEDEWMYFKNQDLSIIAQGGDNVMAILRLSYDHLPRHLKQCFAYCSLFPKDFEIDRVILIDMWIAQGFIQSTTSSRDTEDVANSYFMDLLRRSFFQGIEGFRDYYKMHDLIHDLAKEVADTDSFIVTKTEDIEIVPEQTLHVSCSALSEGSLAFPDHFYGKQMKLRTFIITEASNEMSNSTLEKIISSFERLRVLDLCRRRIKFLPRSLGGLKHLRYLAISSYSIVTLPNSITKLHNLQVLKLNDCWKLKKLPRDIWRLVSLRRLECQGCDSLTHIPPGLWQLESLMHLDFDHCIKLEEMPPGIGQLTSLRTLTRFVVGKESCISGLASDRLNELKGLVDLRGRLRIKFMGRIRATGERTPTDVVKRLKHLRSLYVEFDLENDEEDTGADLIMLEALQPHQNIENLEIRYYRGSRFPSWLMVENLGSLLPKLVHLSIYNCRNLVSLSTCLTHLTSLEDLSVCGCPLLDLSCEEALQFQVPPNLSTFRVVSLDKLTTLPVWLRHMSATLKLILIWNCRNFTTIPEWIGELTALTRLEFQICPKLTSIPEGMRSLTALQEMNISGCSSRLRQRCDKEARGEDWPNIAHIPTLYIKNS